MRKTVLVMASLLAIGGATAGTIGALAQTAAQPGQTQRGPMTGAAGSPEAAPPSAGMMPGGRHGSMPGGMPGGMMEGMHHRMHEGWRGGDRLVKPHDLALVFRQQDRNLSPADVQKIGEAFLLWNGNHTWKITDVSPQGDTLVGFAVTTPEGSVVARFTIDRHSGRVTRTG